MATRHRTIDSTGEVLAALRAADTDTRNWTRRLIPYAEAVSVVRDALHVGPRKAQWRLQDAALLSHVSIIRVSDGGRRIEARYEPHHGDAGAVEWHPLTPHPACAVVAADGSVHYADQLPAGVAPARDDSMWIGLVEMVDHARHAMIGAALPGRTAPGTRR